MKKARISRIVALILVLSMLLSVMPVAFAENDQPLAGKIVILHSNDVHGAIEGYACITALKQQYEEQGAQVLLVDAGDYSQGTTYVSTTKGLDAIEMMNAAGYDLATLGNHEFDYGWPQLKENMESAKFTVLCANVLDENGDPIYAGHTIMDVGGVKIGFFGLETPESQTKANPALIKGLTFLAEDAMYACAQAEVAELTEEGADLIICLSHLGVDASSEPNTSYDLYQNTTGIDFIIDGHSHTVMTEGANGEPIQSTGTAFANIGVVVIDAETKAIESNSLTAVTEDTAKDATVSAAAQAIIDRVLEEYGQVFAKSTVELNGDKDPGNRTEETNLGDLITDAMLWYINKDTGSITVDADHVVAVTNGGGIRAWIHAGDITKNDVNTVLPFGNTVAVVYVTGSELLEALEASTYCTPVSLGGFPQVAGINFTIDTTKEYDKNDEPYPASTYYGPKTINRVTINDINGVAFSENDTYAVITNNFCAAGGDTYYAFASATSQYDTGAALDEVVMSYIKEELDGVVGDAYAEPAGRITVIGENSEWDGKVTIGGLEMNLWTTKYGNIYTDCTASNFVNVLGLEWGDLVTAKFLDQELILPVVSNFSDVDSGTPAIFMAKSDSGDPSGYVYFAINMGNFTSTYGIATSSKDESGNVVWTACDGVTFPIEVTFELYEKEGYMAEYLLHQLSRTNNREDYADLNDSQFANFRNIATTGMGAGTLYRSSSPINPELGRNSYADAAAKGAAVATVMNLADSAETAASYEGFDESYYSQQNVIYLNMGVDFSADSFKESLAEGLRFFASNEGPYLVHCSEGKDRAGFVSAILECLMGATAEEVIADYMVTYYNYYGVEPGTEQYEAIVNSNICKSLATAFGVADITAEDVDLAAEAEAYMEEIGLTAAEISTLKANLSADHGIYMIADGSDMLKYGHIDVDISTDEFTSRFNYGDVVTVTVNGYTFDAPVCTDYTDVKSGATLVRAASGKSYIILAINYGQLSLEAGIAHAEGTGYALNDDVELPVAVTFELKEIGGYLGEWQSHHLERSNNREDYPNLTDEEFANFRVVSTGNLADNTLYRSTSPISDELARNKEADAAAEKAGIKTFINLSDSEEIAKAYSGYEGSYYATQNVIYLDLPVTFTSDAFQQGLADGFRYIASNDGPYLIHCLEGKDRTGMALAILELLTGSTLDEVLDDYMVTYYNFYGVTREDSSYDVILEDNIVTNLQIMLGVEDLYDETLDLEQETYNYLLSIGMTEAEITALKANLTGSGTESAITMPSVAEIDKYGDVRLNITSGDFLALGYDYADYVTVSFLDQTLTLPVIPAYRYVAAKGSALVAFEDATRPVELEIFNGSFAATYGLATKTINEDNTWYWTADEGVTFPVEVTITLAEKNGYYDEYVLFDLVRTNAREDYADLTDEEFANFRNVTTTGMGENVLYRSSSPINPEIGRNTYADAAMEAAGVATVMNLADSKESAAAYEGFADSYYSSVNVVYLNLGVDFTSDTNRAGLAEGLLYFVNNDGPYLVHCNEGQDRAGLVSALLECLMGASLDEVIADYMVTYANYYGVEPGTDQYAAISNNIVKNLMAIFEVDDLTGLDLAQTAASYIEGLGLSTEEVAQLKQNLGGTSKDICDNYSDIRIDSWYHDGVHYMLENGYMVGTGSGQFQPDKSLTRAEFVTLLYRLAGAPAVSDETNLVFTDVVADTWYEDAVIWAVENGITKGTSTTTFSPEEVITREQMATFMCRAYGEDDNTEASETMQAYSDYAQIHEWAKDAMAWAYNEGIIKGTSATTLSPLDVATRAEAATIVMRMFS